MFFAHLPAAYLLNEGLEKALGRPLPREARWAGYVGAITPDVDLIYFYTLDHRHHMHHVYVTHWPSFWIVTGLLLLSIGWTRLEERGRWTVGLFFLNGLFHLVLDSVAGGIYWGAPWSSHLDVIFSVPARYHGTYLNFFLHWTIFFEVGITLAALIVYLRRQSPRSGTISPV